MSSPSDPSVDLRIVARRRILLRESFSGTEFSVVVRVAINLERDTFVVTAVGLDSCDVIRIEHLLLEGESS